MKALALAAALVLPALPAQAAIETQLPVGVEPLAYDLTVTPDAKALTFKGQVTITLTAAKATKQVVLNAADLTISAARLDGAAAKVALDTDAQTVAFTPAKPLKPGKHVLAVTYAGKIKDGPTGLFHVDYEGGRMLMTQFEPADGRRFAPMFDEPAKKALWTVHAVVPAGQMALSNMPQVASKPLAGGLKQVRFAQTPKMSSYLLFFGVGDLERISAQVDGTMVGVVMRKGDTANGRYALDAATKLLAYYNDYFGVKYPLPKLDLIGAPGEAAGAMENWGAILYSQTVIVVDPELSTAADRQTVFNVVAHEMAHQWFGDLVTMAWWDDLWLNEGFANWMATKASDHFHPEWKPLLGAIGDKDEAIQLDAKASTHPVVQTVNTVAQAEQAFDAITYQKGEAVIRMLEGYAGSDAWRDGVRAYMAAHRYGNTASRDLWAAIDKAAGKPISAVAHDFTLQPGAPLISVSGGDKPTLSQGRFGTDEASKAPLTWRVPVLAAPVKGLGGAIISGPEPQSLDGLIMPAIVNAGQTGYYRTAYDPKAFALVAGKMATWPAADQIGLLDDGMALGLGGYEPIGNYLQLATALPLAADPIVWGDAAGGLAGLDSYFDAGPARAAYRAWVQARLKPVLDRVGFDAKPGETDNETILRGALLTNLIALDDPTVLAEARQRFDATGHDPSKLGAETRDWLLPGVAHGADAATFETLRGLAKASRDPLEKQQLYRLLAGVQDEALAQKVLDLAITDEPPTSVGPLLIRAVAAQHPDLAWRFTLANLQIISKGFDSLTRSTFVPRVASWSNDAARATELLAYAETSIPPDAQGPVKVAVDRIRYGAEIKARRVPEINAWLAAHP